MYIQKLYPIRECRDKIRCRHDRLGLLVAGPFPEFGNMETRHGWTRQNDMSHGSVVLFHLPFLRCG